MKQWDRRSVLTGLGGLGAGAWLAPSADEVDVDRLTLLGECDTYRAGMLLNRRPDGSFTNW
jgi:hypothetical protein